MGEGVGGSCVVWGACLVGLKFDVWVNPTLGIEVACTPVCLGSLLSVYPAGVMGSASSDDDNKSTGHRCLLAHAVFVSLSCALHMLCLRWYSSNTTRPRVAKTDPVAPVAALAGPLVWYVVTSSACAAANCESVLSLHHLAQCWRLLLSPTYVRVLSSSA
jgi:hypothetical protein